MNRLSIGILIVVLAGGSGCAVRRQEIARTCCLTGREQGVIFAVHSAGSAVCLAAAEALPPDSIERIILLSPSIASDYDLRPSLRSAREGIDVFCSRLDIWQLGLGVALVGTADGCRGCDAAGRVGF